MSRWEHTVSVLQGPLTTVRLVCLCRWESPPLSMPTVSALTEIAREHRRQAQSDRSDGRCTYHWATERCPMPANHTGRHIFDNDRAIHRHPKTGERP